MRTLMVVREERVRTALKNALEVKKFEVMVQLNSLAAWGAIKIAQRLSQEPFGLLVIDEATQAEPLNLLTRIREIPATSGLPVILVVPADHISTALSVPDCAVLPLDAGHRLDQVIETAITQAISKGSTWKRG